MPEPKLIQVEFNRGRKGDLVAFIGGKPAFPDRRGPQPCEGDIWNVEIAGENPAQTVIFLRLITRISTLNEREESESKQRESERAQIQNQKAQGWAKLVEIIKPIAFEHGHFYVPIAQFMAAEGDNAASISFYNKCDRLITFGFDSTDKLRTKLESIETENNVYANALNSFLGDYAREITHEDIINWLSSESCITTWFDNHDAVKVEFGNTIITSIPNYLVTNMAHGENRDIANVITEIIPEFGNNYDSVMRFLHNRYIVLNYDQNANHDEVTLLAIEHANKFIGKHDFGNIQVDFSNPEISKPYLWESCEEGIGHHDNTIWTSYSTRIEINFEVKISITDINISVNKFNLLFG
jgi:hypothetical protein